MGLGHEGGVLRMEEEETLESLLDPSAMCGHSQQVAVCKSG